ncbi:MAG: hypothetical protein K2Q32_04175 [Alphaproteobacteria bacterium]|nr:hypothetical protein [Alphaproteobacteria bacterium]
MTNNAPMNYFYKPLLPRKMGLYAPLLRGDIATIQLRGNDNQNAELTIKCSNSGAVPPLFGGSKFLIVDEGNASLGKGNFLKPEQIADAKVVDIKNTTIRNRLVRGLYATRSAFKFFPAIS